MILCPRCDLAMSEGATRCLRCGAAVSQTPPSVLIDGRYAVEREVGHGAMGVVYLARDVNLGRAVALKVIAPEFVAQSSFAERFRAEATALASIRNAHVVQVYAMGHHDKSLYFAMEYIEGRNLEDIVREHALHGTFVPTYRALTILKQVALGLGAVHDAGIVHRDIKPANVVIEDGTGRPVILDFGLARPVDAQTTRNTAPVGSPPYMAPEQIVGAAESIGPRTDLYALACAGFELLTGAPPFEGEQVMAVLYRHLHEAPPAVSSRRKDLAVLDEIFVRALAKDPIGRYQDAQAFADAMDEAASRWRAQSATARPPAPGATVSAPPEEHSFRVLIVDDDPDFCRYAERAATLAMPDVSVEVTSVNAGLRALTAAIRRRPQLILLDYDMPGINGLETLAELRALPGLQGAHVLVVSASVGTVERWRFTALGVRDFLEKPVALGELAETIARLARRAHSNIAATQGDPSVGPTLAPPGPGRRRLAPEVFLLLLAVAWADGTLDPEERDAVLRAAREADATEAEMHALEEASRAPVELGDIDVSGLSTGDRCYVYAMARWIAAINGTITDKEEAMLHVLGFALGLSGRGRSTMDQAVRELLAAPQGQRPSRFDLAGLQVAIAQSVEAAQGRLTT